MDQLIAAAGHRPQRPAFLAPGAWVIGQVRFGPGCGVWFNAVLRADLNPIELDEGCNVQDLACVHVSRRRGCRMAARVSVGHGAIVHACTVGAGTLVGMGAKILDGAEIGAGCLIAAGAVVPEGMTVPDGHLVAGVPGRVVKPLSAELRERIARIAGDYLAYQQLYPAILAEAACA